MGLKNKKSPVEFTPDEMIAEKIKEKMENGYLSCTAAFKLADQLGLSNGEIGRYADVLDLRLTKCRIGLFGHGKGVKLVKQLESVDEALESRVNQFVKNERVNCEDVLKVADEFKISPVKVGSVCQTKGLKIKNCCLGAF